MKKIIQIIICVMALLAIAFIPEVHNFVLGTEANNSLLLAGVYAPLLWKSGKDNMGGYKDRVLWIPADAVSKVPTLPDKITADTDYVTATGSFEFKDSGNKPLYIYCTSQTVKYGAENQGEVDGQSFKQSGEFFFPGNEIETHILNRKMNNTSGYLIIEDTNGKQFMIGQPGLCCYVKPSFDGGQKRADRRGTKYTFEADSYGTAITLAVPIDMDALITDEANTPNS